MFLSLEINHSPASDIGYLINKYPGKEQQFQLNIGVVNLWWSHLSDNKAIINLYLDLKNKDYKGAYISPYLLLANSYLTVAINKLFSSLLNGNNESYLVNKKLDLKLTLSPVLYNQDKIERLFSFLNYKINYTQIQNNICELELSNTIELSKALEHLYILLPVLHSETHQYLTKEDLDKFNKRTSWLENHPAKTEIIKTYFKKSFELKQKALKRHNIELQNESNLTLLRDNFILKELLEIEAKKVLEISAGNARLANKMLNLDKIDVLTLTETNYKAINKIKENINKEVNIINNALPLVDYKLQGYDLIILNEIIEHINQPLLPNTMQTLLANYNPKYLFFTTPNRDYNTYWNLKTLRRKDHYFEFSFLEAKEFFKLYSYKYNYNFEIKGIGDKDLEYGYPSLFIKLTRNELKSKL